LIIPDRQRLIFVRMTTQLVSDESVARDFGHCGNDGGIFDAPSDELFGNHF
jgi:hypothetical protein